MKAKARQSGMTLTEMTVVILAAALLASLAAPAVRGLLGSFESPGSTRAMISAAMASARAIAAKEHRYAGIRFQKAYDAKLPTVDCPQYMIFIIHDPNLARKDPCDYELPSRLFRAVEGLKPIRLPDSVGVMDLELGSISVPGPLADDVFEPGLKDRILTDTTTFSVVFAPSGKLVIRGVQTRNRDGYPPSELPFPRSYDDVFNKLQEVARGTGMFVQDDDENQGSGLWQELSRSSFIIYETAKFKKAYERGRAYSEYLALLGSKICINPYTGALISESGSQ
ncbi:MAG TPA: prepilin-type N-terminal cleavage/methylation domain-containing protein [Sedimentisphaerales bacterium]|nr:prepilin-type N-terminal cleavage/methylation domain-containing protein [Sedimentisphaerales bacterium]